MNDWISVLDDVPDSGEPVIMYVCSPEYKGNHRIMFGRYWVDARTDIGQWEPDGWDKLLDSYGGVSHWMPLPDPPVED